MKSRVHLLDLDYAALSDQEIEVIWRSPDHGNREVDAAVLRQLVLRALPIIEATTFDEGARRTFSADDLEGRAEPIERYLELVPKSERAQLADLLAMYFASRRGPASREVNSQSYERVLAAIDRLNESQGEAGILPALLSELRRTRRLRRQDVTRELCDHFKLSDKG